MKQFDIYNVSLDPAVGKEIKKTRPAIILSPDSMNRHLGTVLIAPLTHTNKGYPSRIPSDFNGEDGEIVLDQIRSVDKSRLSKKIGTLDKATCQDVCAVLQTMFQYHK
jgi:mRNA interferase MazF